MEHEDHHERTGHHSTAPEAQAGAFSGDGFPVRFEEGDGVAVIRSTMTKQELIEERIRRVTGTADQGLSTDEIMRLTRGED